MLTCQVCKVTIFSVSTFFVCRVFQDLHDFLHSVASVYGKFSQSVSILAFSNCRFFWWICRIFCGLQLFWVLTQNHASAKYLILLWFSVFLQDFCRFAGFFRSVAYLQKIISKKLIYSKFAPSEKISVPSHLF